MVKIKNFTCGYDNQKVIENFNAIFKKGEITAINGNSGRGKTTLLKSINRLHEVQENSFFQEGIISAVLDNNEVNIYEQNPIYIRRKIGYIFQSPTVLPMSIEKNVSIGLKISGIKDDGLVEKALKSVYLWDEVKDRLDKDANILSLGQKQRLSIARVLVLNPEVLLFDEPTSSLDKEATLKLEETMVELKNDKVIILVTHDQSQVKRICDKEIKI